MEISEIFTEETNIPKVSGSVFKIKLHFEIRKMLTEFCYRINQFFMMMLT